MPRGSLSNVLDASSKQENLVNKKPVTSLLRPIYSRMQSRSLVAGRVIVWPEATSAENATHQQRLHPSNACLAGTKRAGGDSGRITLDLTTNASSLVYSLYPGHPVVLTATNLTGRSLTAFEFYQVRPKPSNHLPVSTLDVPDLHVAVACGPFTTTTSHDISPLLALLKDIKEYRPHVLILLGPLVDSSHPLIEEYRDSTYEELYQSRLNTVAEWCHLLKTSVVIVSSWREICGNPVYPTPPPFGSGKPYWTQKNPELATWYENVTFVWDPCTLRIGPFVMGLSSPDVLFQMSSEEINANCTGDRLARLCRHVLTAANFYPIHPPAESLPLDYPLWQDHAHFPSNRSPHCLVLPSRLRAFIKVIYVACSSTAAGSYARLIFSIKDSSADLQESAMDVVSWAGDEKTATDSTKSGVTILGEVVQL
ncbi:unnamed protein product [Mesocestoides corti]|uniref:DNA polymerase alpha subunit B n=1 Tax=Mesocestoides corti TaxID=53468 RepID=A0A0R3UNE0_MESCO|nr:unnamed protein product [Mesocestoides corti]